MREYTIIASHEGLMPYPYIRSHIEARHMPEAFSLFLAENEEAISRAEPGITVTIFTVGENHAGDSD